MTVPPTEGPRLREEAGLPPLQQGAPEVRALRNRSVPLSRPQNLPPLPLPAGTRNSTAPEAVISTATTPAPPRPAEPGCEGRRPPHHPVSTLDQSRPNPPATLNPANPSGRSTPIRDRAIPLGRSVRPGSVLQALIEEEQQLAASVADIHALIQRQPRTMHPRPSAGAQSITEADMDGAVTARERVPFSRPRSASADSRNSRAISPRPAPPPVPEADAARAFWSIVQALGLRQDGLHSDRHSTTGFDTAGGLRFTPQRPPPFSGGSAREWLDLLDTYYKVSGFSDEQRFYDAQLSLRGGAQRYWHQVKRAHPDRLPTTWQEFGKFLVHRYSSKTEAEICARLRQLRFAGDLNALTDQFAEILGEGELPPERELARLFLSRFPLSMVKQLARAGFRRFDTWLDVRDAIQSATDYDDSLIQFWKGDAPHEFLREPGTRPITQDPSQRGAPRQLHQRPGGGGLRPPSHPGTTAATPGRVHGQQPRTSPMDTDARRSCTLCNRRAPPGAICTTCNGSGHEAALCPTTNASLTRPGEHCKRCHGSDHWAQNCPTPPPPNWKGQRPRPQNFQAPSPGVGQTHNKPQGNGQA